MKSSTTLMIGVAALCITGCAHLDAEFLARCEDPSGLTPNEQYRCSDIEAEARRICSQHPLGSNVDRACLAYQRVKLDSPPPGPCDQLPNGSGEYAQCLRDYGNARAQCVAHDPGSPIERDCLIGNLGDQR